MKIMLIWKEFDLKIFTSLNSVMQKNMIVSFQSPPPPPVLTIVDELKHFKSFEINNHVIEG